MNNQRPLGKRKTVQLLLILTILAWATQTLVHQWGFGQTVDPSDSTPPDPLGATPEMVAGDKFVPSDTVSAGGRLELRGEATVLGAEVKLKQVCRWSDSDAAMFAPIADLTLFRMSDSTPFRSVSVDEIRQTLHDAGVNLATIDFVGAASCTVTRSDAQTDERTALKNWIDSHTPASPNAAPATQPAPAANSTDSPTTVPSGSAQAPYHSLRDLLTMDLCQRLSISPDIVQMTFSPEDEKVLALVDACFKFDIDPTRVRNLGQVAWDVTIISGTETNKVHIRATAREWQDQVIVARPIALRQILAESDFNHRRVLSDDLPEQTLLTLPQCVGQQSTSDLTPGTVMTARMVEAVPLVHSGDLVTITLQQGSVQIKAVARATEPGTLGQTIKVRNETTHDVFDVVVVGEQEARLGVSPADAGIASASGR